MVTKAEAMQQPAGLEFDVLHDIRKAMRTLRAAEKRIAAHGRLLKRQQKLAAERQEAERVRKETPKPADAPATKSREPQPTLEPLNRLLAGAFGMRKRK